MNERTTTEMLVRPQGVAGRSAVPVSLRTESVLESPEDERKRKRREAQRRHALAWYRRNRDYVVQKLREKRRQRGAPERQWRTKEEVAEYRKQWRAINKAKCKAYRAKWSRENKEKVNAQQRRWRKANNDYARQRDKKYRAKRTRETMRDQMRRFREKHPEYSAMYHRKQIVNLADWYVRARMSRGTAIPPKAWPDGLVELNKTNIKLKRQLWHSQKTSTNSVTNS